MSVLPDRFCTFCCILPCAQAPAGFGFSFLECDAVAIIARESAKIIPCSWRTFEADNCFSAHGKISVEESAKTVKGIAVSQYAREDLGKMLVAYYLLVNRDRYQNNFGVLRNADTLQCLGI